MKRLLVHTIKKLGYDIHKLRDSFIDQKKLIPKPGIIIDAGGHYGETTIKYKQQYSNSKIFIFEPTEFSFKKLKATFSDKSIFLVNKGLASVDGEKEFFKNAYDGTNSFYPRPKSGKAYYPPKGYTVETCKVPVVRLDTFARENQISHIDILKMDIQGSELDALKGAEKLLKSKSIDLIYTEVFFIPHYEGAPLFDSVFQYLNSFGYTLYGVYNNFHAPPQTDN